MLPVELFAIIVEFTPQVKSLMFCCRDSYAAVVELDEATNGAFLDSRVNPIMTLWAYFPYDFDPKQLMKNPDITAEVYEHLQEVSGIKRPEQPTILFDLCWSM